VKHGFTTLTAVAAPLDLANVDTDKIIPARFLKTIKRSGLGQSLFADMRYDAAGSEKPEFVLNQEKYRHAGILIAGANFGCGSSREHAPWALLDFGIRCIIAPSFADIFHGNCFKNSILPITLAPKFCSDLMAGAASATDPSLTVDLAAQVVVTPSRTTLAFDVDAFRKDCLIRGLDDIGLTLAHARDIDAFESRRHGWERWLPVVSIGQGS
jgi:3-isopropylmalate/(R)-2-methylmalate dehydratase small subunit